MESNFSPIEQFVNVPELLARVDNDAELVQELMALLQEELPNHQDALRSAINRGDLEAVERAAHAFKGVLANLSIRRGTELAARIETAARSGGMIDIQEIMAAFTTEIAELSAAVDGFMSGREK